MYMFKIMLFVIIKINSLMSYFRENEQSFSYQYDSHNESFETETQFLKDKLIQTHQKLMRQLARSREFEDKIYKVQKKNEALVRENEHFQSKYCSLQKKYDYDKAQTEKKKFLQMKIEELQKKNELLKVDIESMRNKMLQAMVQKNELEQDLSLKEQLIQKLNEKTNSFSIQLRQKIKEIKYYENELQAYKKKYEIISEQCQRNSNQLHELKMENNDNYQQTVQLQSHLRQERDKNSKIMNEIFTIQSQHKQLLNKHRETEIQCESYKDQIYWLQNKEKTQNKNTQEHLEKLSLQLSNMNNLYKQKEKQLEIAKRKPLQNLHKKKKNLQNAKDFVYKLESEEKSKRGYRVQTQSNRQNSYSPKNTKYKQEKDNYISMISEVGDMETILTNCNLERKKILAELDKIQQTKIKTKDIINRRRRLEDDLSYQEEKIRKVKEELRKMKVL